MMGLTNDGTSNEEFKTEPDIKVIAKKGITLQYDLAIQKVKNLENSIR